jgi:hypothetical protein
VTKPRPGFPTQGTPFQNPVVGTLPQAPNPATQASIAPQPSPGSGFGPPPKYVPPQKAKPARTKFISWAESKGVASATASDIWYWSTQYKNVDPYLWSSVLIKESGAKHVNGNGSIVSSGQAVGIGQIALTWVGQPIPWDKGHKFTADNDPRTGIAAYGVNLRMSAYLWGDAVGKYGWKNAYTQGYNPNDPKKAQAWKDIQATYTSRPAGTAPVGPSEGAGEKTPAGTTAYPTFTDPFVTGVKKGGKFATTGDPNKALQFDGQPLTRSSFLSLKDQLTSYYVSYTGQRPSNGQIQQYILKGWSPYTLQTLLSKGPHFTTSPIYKEYNGNWQNDPTIKAILGPDGKIPTSLIQQGIVNNWDATTIAQKLRAAPGYVKSNEFRGNVATLLNTYQSVIGHPDPDGMVTIKNAALSGWTTDQFASYLRSQPQYRAGTEYQGRMLNFASALGLITGSQPVIQSVSTPPTQLAPNTQGAPPADKRVPGQAGIDNPFASLGVTLSGG